MGAQNSRDIVETAFDLVKERKGAEKLRALLSQGDVTDAQKKRLFEARDHYGRSLLMVACDSGNVRCVSLLINEGAYTWQRADNGWTALHYACSLKKEDKALEIVSILLSASADPIVRDYKRRTIFHLAQLNNKPATLRLIESRICDFVGPLRIEAVSGFQNGVGNLFGDGAKKSLVSHFGSSWKNRWVVVTRLKGSMKMAKFPRLQCPKCLTVQEEIKEDRVHVTCKCGQILIVPPKQREEMNCLTIYHNNNSSLPDLVLDLTDSRVEMTTEHGQSIIVLTLGEAACNKMDPAYLIKPRSIDHFRATKRKFSVKGYRTIRMTSSDRGILQTAFNAFQREMRVFADPDVVRANLPPPNHSQRYTESDNFAVQQQNSNDVPVAIAVGFDDDIDPSAFEPFVEEPISHDRTISDYSIGKQQPSSPSLPLPPPPPPPPSPPFQRDAAARSTLSLSRSPVHIPVSPGGSDRSSDLSLPVLPPKPQKYQRTGPSWDCAKCTYKNPMSLGACEMCGEARSESRGEDISAPSAPMEFEVESAAFAAAEAASILEAPVHALKSNNSSSSGETDLELFLCPITHKVMTDPVTTADGITYERSAIQKWFADGKTCSPVTSEPLESQVLIPNLSLKKMIDKKVASGAITI